MQQLSTPKKTMLPHRKHKLRKEPKAPALTKVLPINPFASWNMPPEARGYIKAKDRDCL
jgi:hypothetical protein